MWNRKLALAALLVIALFCAAFGGVHAAPLRQKFSTIKPLTVRGLPDTVDLTSPGIFDKVFNRRGMSLETFLSVAVNVTMTGSSCVTIGSQTIVAGPNGATLKRVGKKGMLLVNGSADLVSGKAAKGYAANEVNLRSTLDTPDFTSNISYHQASSRPEQKPNQKATRGGTRSPSAKVLPETRATTKLKPAEGANVSIAAGKWVGKGVSFNVSKDGRALVPDKLTEGYSLRFDKGTAFEEASSKARIPVDKGNEPGERKFIYILEDQFRLNGRFTSSTTWDGHIEYTPPGADISMELTASWVGSAD